MIKLISILAKVVPLAQNRLFVSYSYSKNFFYYAIFLFKIQTSEPLSEIVTLIYFRWNMVLITSIMT